MQSVLGHRGDALGALVGVEDHVDGFHCGARRANYVGTDRVDRQQRWSRLRRVSAGGFLYSTGIRRPLQFALDPVWRHFRPTGAAPGRCERILEHERRVARDEPEPARRRSGLGGLAGPGEETI